MFGESFLLVKSLVIWCLFLMTAGLTHACLSPYLFSSCTFDPNFEFARLIQILNFE